MKQQIENLIRQALKNLDITDANFVVEHPEDMKNGDYSTNVAMVCAKQLKMNPKELAEKIAAAIFSAKAKEDSQIEKVEVAGAGFINFYITKRYFQEELGNIISLGDKYGVST